MEEESKKCSTCGRTGINFSFCEECKSWFCPYHINPNHHDCIPSYYRRKKQEFLDELNKFSKAVVVKEPLTLDMKRVYPKVREDKFLEFPLEAVSIMLFICSIFTFLFLPIVGYILVGLGIISFIKRSKMLVIKY